MRAIKYTYSSYTLQQCDTSIVAASITKVTKYFGPTKVQTFDTRKRLLKQYGESDNVRKM